MWSNKISTSPGTPYFVSAPNTDSAVLARLPVRHLVLISKIQS